MTEREIYDCAASVALSASAGSGKTHALTTRLLALLLSGAEPSDILAVTFTKSAAQDIRKKLFDRITALESEALNGSEAPIRLGRADRSAAERALFAGILGLEEGTIPAMAKQLRLKLVRQFSLLQISTIHGFFARFLHSFPAETGFFGDLTIIDERMKRKLIRESFERFYEDLSRDRELSERILQFLAHFRERNLRAGSTLRDVFESVERRSYALRGLLGRFEDCRALEREHAGRLESLRTGALDSVIEFIAEIVGRRLETRGKDRNLASFLRELRFFQSARNIRKLAGLTPFIRGDRGPVAYIEAVRAWLPSDEGERFAGAIAAVSRSVRDYLEAEMRAYACVYLDVFNRVNRIYAEIKRNANAADFTDLELLALGLGTGLADFDYFSFRIGSRIRHVLIDEFQDTSLLQWDSLKPFVDHAVRGGGSFFYVGDAKQSIYRWRGGDPTLFERVAEEERALERSLSYSWRQNGLLLGFTNDLFEEIGRRVPEFRYERAAMPPEREGPARGYLAIRQCRDREEVLAGVLDSLRFLEESGVSFDDCAVLCRTNKELEEVETLLTRERIPFVSPGRSWLLADWAVQDLLALLRLVTGPCEEIAAAGLLRSPVFRASYEDAAATLGANRGKRRAPADIDAPGAASGGDAGIRGTGFDPGSAAGLVAELAERGSWLTPTGFLRMIFESFGLLDLYSGKRDALLELYERAWVFEKVSRGLLLSDFIEYLEEGEGELTVGAGEGRGARLLTVHSAKGLEFHSVIVPFLSKPLGLDADGSLLFGEIGGREGFLTIFANSLYREYFSRDLRYGPLFQEAELNARVDELNVLYVALTRARENLFILPRTRFRAGEREPKTVGDVLLSARTAHREAHPGGDLAQGVSGGGLFREEAGSPVPSEEPRTVFRRMYRSPGASSPGAPARPETAEPGRTAADLQAVRAGSRPARQAGTGPIGALAWDEDEPDRGFPGGGRKRRVESLKGLLVHKALEMAEELPLGGDDLELLLRRAIARIGARYTRGERTAALEKAEQSLGNVIADERMADYFGKGAAREIVFLSGGYGRGMGRIDRAVLGNEVGVVDFKTNETGGTGRMRELVALYRSQVVSYCASLARIFPGRPVKGALYFTDAPYDERIVTVYDEGKTRPVVG